MTGALTARQLDQLEALSVQAHELSKRRDEMHSAWLKLRVVPAGSNGKGHLVFNTIASLGAQLESVWRRMDSLLDGAAA